MASVTHTMTGETAPAFAPPSIGAHYTCPVTKQNWISHGDDSVEDWGMPLPSAPLTLDQTVGTAVVRADRPAIHWLVDNSVGRSLYFDSIEVAGLHKFEVVVESYNSAEVTVQVSGAVSGPYFNVPTSLTVTPESANYYTFLCWVNDQGRNYWSLLESRVLSGEPEKVNSFGDTPTVVTLNNSNPATYWSISSQKSRSLVLPDFTGVTFPVEHALVLRNSMNAELVVSVDEALGLALRDHATLIVPANAAILFKLVYYPAPQPVRWSVILSHTL